VTEVLHPGELLSVDLAGTMREAGRNAVNRASTLIVEQDAIGERRELAVIGIEGPWRVWSGRGSREFERNRSGSPKDTPAAGHDGYGDVRDQPGSSLTVEEASEWRRRQARSPGYVPGKELCLRSVVPNPTAAVMMSRFRLHRIYDFRLTIYDEQPRMHKSKWKS